MFNNFKTLLFSESSMKTAHMKLNFENDTIILYYYTKWYYTFFNENIPLITIDSGHYTFHNTKLSAKQIIGNTDRKASTQIFLLAVVNQDSWSTSLKLHRKLAQWWCMDVLLKSSYPVGGP